jgi:hypothetical protein
MKPPEAPRLDTRRTEQFRDELIARARAWIPGWDLSEDQRDFGRALLEIAARFNAEVTERLDGAGEKMRRSFLDWLAVRREAARPSRVPVVFKLNDNAQTAVLADAPVRLQADAAGVPVVFETEKDVRVIPGTLGAVVAVDADADAFYLPPPGLSDLQPLESLPTVWQLRSFAAVDARKLQVTPDTGLTPEMLVEIDAWQYRITEVAKDIVTINPPLAADLPEGTPVRKVVVFAPYESGVRDRQEHALYLGHMDLLNLESPATIDVVGAQDLRESVEWQYFGKLGDGETDDWQPLTLAGEQKADAVVLRKEAGAVAVHSVNGISSRWIRAYRPKAESNQPALNVERIELRLNCLTDTVACPTVEGEPPSPAAEAMANTTPLTLDETFFPFGKEPRQFDAFYLGSREAFSKRGANVQLCFNEPPQIGIRAPEIRMEAVADSHHPELSWEYFNGKGWWGLDIETEETQQLRQGGVVRFTVPSDIAESDWAGKTSFWIRARLVGGDYGKEKVTVITEELDDDTSEQTVNRSTEDILPPTIASLHISYRVCTEEQPMFVLAQDSGSYRDQSDANRTAGAMVEAFVPLSVTLGRLANSMTLADTQADTACQPDCQCPGASVDVPTGLPSGAPVPMLLPIASIAPASGRALLIGFTAPPSDAPVNVLLLVDRERDFSALAPMTVEALTAEGFVPLLTDDASRAIGESGILSMAFAVPPTPRELFGQTMSWVRLTPGAPPAGTAAPAWSPTLRGAYLNAAWAAATETLTRELLGSSDGAPHLTFTLARPPVLRDTLELRVREPLGEEERAELAAADPDRVRSNDESLPGDWVLWTRVTDPGDEGPAARVYALDEATGVVTFGDGLHGMIPPIGRDSIVAFAYQRTETGASPTGAVPGNSVTARTPFNLISPVQGVESVIAADQAAGGSPPESDERVLRFGFAQLRHRRRAVTARDLEDLALQSSPDIAQVRCLVRQSHVKLVVVMRGNHPQPTAAEIRELRRLLLTAAPEALSAPNALRIQGPVVRNLRVHLKLRVPGLGVAGDVAREAKQRLAWLFDTATGGADQQGWLLGENPTDGDIAYALIDLPDLDSIEGVTLHESEGRRTGLQWPASLKPNELAVLADDPVRIEFVTGEVVV